MPETIHEELSEKHVGKRLRLQFMADGPGRIMRGTVLKLYEAEMGKGRREQRFSFAEDNYAHPNEYTQRYWRVVASA